MNGYCVTTADIEVGVGFPIKKAGTEVGLLMATMSISVQQKFPACVAKKWCMTLEHPSHTAERQSTLTERAHHHGDFLLAESGNYRQCTY